MIKVYESTATNFHNMGLGPITPTSCKVSEELNGMFELELEHPFDPGGKYKRLKNENIIKASTPAGDQLFRIYRTNPTLTSIKAYAHHISYDLLDNYIHHINLVNPTAQAILNAIKANLMIPSPFTFNTDLAGDTPTFIANNINPIKAIISDDEDQDSIIRLFGGELVRDNFTIKMLKNRGADRGVQIRYGKNLIGLSVDEDDGSVVNRVVPIGSDGLTLPEIYINAQNQVGRVRVATQEFNGAKTAGELRQMATDWVNMASNPKVNIKADIQLLSKTTAYQDYAILETVEIGDILTVINTKRGFNKKATVISYEWDSLRCKYNQVELGDFIQDITSSLGNIDKSISYATTAITESKQVMQAISGKIAITTDYLYISTDGNSYLDATKIFRFGTQGLQHSSDGYHGTYKTIIDKDGNVITPP